MSRFTTRKKVTVDPSFLSIRHFKFSWKFSFFVCLQMKIPLRVSFRWSKISYQVRECALTHSILIEKFGSKRRLDSHSALFAFLLGYAVGLLFVTSSTYLIAFSLLVFYDYMISNVESIFAGAFWNLDLLFSSVT